MVAGDGGAACLLRGEERRVDRRGKTRWTGAGPLGCLLSSGQTDEGLAGTTAGCLGRLNATSLGLERRMGSSRRRVCCLDGCSSPTRPNLTCDARSSQSRGRRTVACCWAEKRKKRTRQWRAMVSNEERRLTGEREMQSRGGRARRKRVGRWALKGAGRCDGR